MISKNKNNSVVLLAIFATCFLAGCEQRTVVLNSNQNANVSAQSAGVRNGPFTGIGAQCKPPANANTYPPPNFVVKASPVIPQRAHDEKVEGCSGVKFRIASDGSVVDATIVTEYPLNYGFGDATVQFLTASKFPASSDNTKWYYYARSYVK